MQDIDEKVQELWEAGWTIIRISKELKVYRDKVRAVLEAQGISKETRMERSIHRKTDDAELCKRIVEAWNSGEGYRIISEREDVSDKIIKKILDAAGVPTEGRRTKARSRKVASHCCACTILLQYAENYATIFCEDCSYLECTRRKREVGVMCTDCQRHLNVEPRCAGNIEVP